MRDFLKSLFVEVFQQHMAFVSSGSIIIPSSVSRFSLILLPFIFFFEDTIKQEYRTPA